MTTGHILFPKTPALLEQVAGFCRQISASLTLMHVGGAVTDWPALARERALQDQFREAARGRIAALQRSAGVEAPLVVVVGDVVDAVSAEARREAVDLLIIERSPCPILSV